MRRKPRKKEDDNGFSEWGGYMGAKKAKLEEQFNKVTVKQAEKKSDIFKCVSIMVNGYTKPGAEELKSLMAAHGGHFHLYQNQFGVTTHIIATNLPNVKINQLGNVPVVNPQWITESVEANKLLDYKKYLLYTNQSRTQPKLNFAIINKQDNQRIEHETPQKHAKTASDPQFLSDFYNNSRLHLISTLGAEFKQLVNKLREEQHGHFPGLEKLMLLREEPSNHVENLFENGNVIMHIDMDCFFVSVGLRNRPDLRGKPVAVTHSRGGRSNPSNVSRQAEVDLYMKRLPEGAAPKLNLIDDKCSMAEIASCSYEARRYGIKNGMLMGTGLKLCPDLVPIPYDFQDYKDVSSILYNTIAEYTVDIEAVSCDEMYVDVTKILQKSGLSVNEWAKYIRGVISERTGCPCSTGFGLNKLQARLATKKAKPNGQYYLKPDQVENYMYELALDELPGVGYVTLIKLNNLGLKTCGDIYNVSLSTLKNELGQKNSETIYDQARGIDNKPLNYEHERKSVSADINYGIRFKNKEEALEFLERLSKEVYGRLIEIKMRAKTLTLKLLIRAEEAPKETAKYLGCGVCNAMTRSITSNHYLDSPETIFKEAKALFNRLSIIPEDLRGVGIQLTKLEKVSMTNKVLTKFLNQTNKLLSATVTSNALENMNDENKNDVSVEKKTDLKILKKNINGGNFGVNLDKKRPTILKEKKEKSKGEKYKNTLNVVTNKSALTNYFRSSKNEFTTKQMNYKQESIDLNILKELPKDLQEEVIKEYNLPTPMLDESENHATTSNILPFPGKQDFNRNEDTKMKKMGFSDLSKEELKMLLKNWVRNEQTPKDRDVTMLSDFFRILVQERKIEYLFSMVNLLHRHVTKKSCNWHNAYLQLLNSFQEVMLVVYGNTLLVPAGFACCNSI